MLYGIDISNWQKGLNVPESLDFCIVKATEGLRFVDPCCDGFVSQCKSKGIRFGFYHFMRANEPEKEAHFFWESTKGYTYDGIPVLDIEDERIPDWGNYAQRFVDKYHAITGVFPVVYCSAAHLSRFNGYPLVDDCGLWIAGYPSAAAKQLKEVPRFPYDVSPWKFAALWQFTSNGLLSNWDEPVDLDVAYMDSTAWKLYANPDYVDASNVTSAMPNTTESPEQKRTHTFENSFMRVDVTLK